MVKDKENTAEFKQFLCLVPTREDEGRRLIFPAHVPEHIMTSLAIWGTLPHPPENLWAVLLRHFRALTVAMAVSLFIYFHSERFPFPDSLLRFTSCITSGDSGCFITGYLPAAGPAWRRSLGVWLASLIYFPELSNVGRAQWTVLLNDHYYTVMFGMIRGWVGRVSVGWGTGFRPFRSCPRWTSADSLGLYQHRDSMKKREIWLYLRHFSSSV